MRVAFLIFGFMVPILSILQFAYYLIQMFGNIVSDRVFPILLSFTLSILISAVVSMLCFYAAREIKKEEDAAWEELE